MVLTMYCHGLISQGFRNPRLNKEYNIEIFTYFQGHKQQQKTFEKPCVKSMRPYMTRAGGVCKQLTNNQVYNVVACVIRALNDLYTSSEHIAYNTTPYSVSQGTRDFIGPHGYQPMSLDLCSLLCI